MNFAVVNPNTNKVENIVSVEPVAVEGLQNGMGMRLEKCQDVPAEIGDEFNHADGKFYRGGVEVSTIPNIGEQIQQALDNYTLELIESGVI